MQEQQRPTLGDVLTAMAQKSLSGLCVCRPAKVTRKLSDREVEVSPLVAARDGTEDPGLKGVPLVMPGTKRIYLGFPVKEGDPVLLVFGDRDLDQWQSKGGTTKTTAESGREHDITDAIAIPLVLRPSATAVEVFELLSAIVDALANGEIVAPGGGGTCDVSYNTEMKINLAKLKLALGVA
jgi:hypothetical protein